MSLLPKYSNLLWRKASKLHQNFTYLRNFDATKKHYYWFLNFHEQIIEDAIVLIRSFRIQSFLDTCGQLCYDFAASELIPRHYHYFMQLFTICSWPCFVIHLYLMSLSRIIMFNWVYSAVLQLLTEVESMLE